MQATANPVLDILTKQVKSYGDGGQRKAAAELECSSSVISQYMNNKYPGDVEKLERKIIAMYGGGGLVACPERGPITPSDCTETHKRAFSIGLKAGNPDTQRLYVKCQACTLRKGGN